MTKLGLAAVITAGVLLAGPALAQDQPLARLVQFVIAKGYTDITLGQLCQRFSISVPRCVAYQVNDDEIDPLPSFNTLKDSRGVDKVILAIHGPNAGFAYLTGISGKLEAVAKGIKTTGWLWDRIAITDQVRAAYQKQYDYWKSNEEVVANLPDRPAAAGAQPR